MKTYFILNLQNVDFVFNYLIDNEYRYGYGELASCYSIQEIKRDVRNELLKEKRTTSKKCIAIPYLELDNERHRYMLYTKWWSGTNDIMNSISSEILELRELNIRNYLNKKGTQI